jgi:hypothetical protein
MKVHITLMAAHGGGKSHLAQALKDWFQVDYDNAAPLEVTIIERYPPNCPETSTTGHVFFLPPRKRP